VTGCCEHGDELSGSNAGNVLAGCATVNFSIRTQLHGVNSGQTEFRGEICSNIFQLNRPVQYSVAG
jgi:hypothetical protein